VVCRQILLDLVAECSDEPQTIFKLDQEGLIVYRLPDAFDRWVQAFVIVTIWTELANGREVRKNLNTPDIFTIKRKLMLPVDDLNQIRYPMRAHLLLLEEIYDGVLL